MLNQATMDMLTAMKLTAMAAEFANQLKDPTFNELGFEWCGIKKVDSLFSRIS